MVRSLVGAGLYLVGYADSWGGGITITYWKAL